MISVGVSMVLSQQERRQLAALDPSGGFGSTLSLNGFMAQKAKDLTWFAQKAVIDAADGRKYQGKGSTLSPAYLKRKAAGKTKGKGAFGVPAMLMDSGKTVSGIQAVVNQGRDLSIELRVPDLLSYHMTGAGRLPVRNPLKPDVLEQWQRGFEADLNAFLSGEVRSWQRSGAMSVLRQFPT